VLIVLAVAVVTGLSLSQLSAQQPVTLTVRVDQPGVKIDPLFYGLMTEEINFSYDGGLYAELIRNRTFRDNAQNPVNWSVVKYDGGEGTIALEKDAVPNTALTMALKLDASALKPKQRVGVANEGYWGIPVKPDTAYRASFYAKASGSFRGLLPSPLRVMMDRPSMRKPVSAKLHRNGKNTPSLEDRETGIRLRWANRCCLHRSGINDKPVCHLYRYARHGLVQPGVVVSSHL
jgi:hypothetical protein